MTGTPNLGLPLMSTNDAQKEVLFNEAIIAFDIMAARVVTSILAAPPVSPAVGATYIVATGPSGDWLGQAGNIAFYFNGWQFLEPVAKMKMWVAAANAYYTFSGAVWNADPVSAVNTLDDLGDIALTSLTDGDILKWDNTAHKWKNVPAIGISGLGALSDVSIPSPDGGQVLAYNDTIHKWVAITLPDIGSPGVDRLQDLTDVDWTDIADGKVLAWDATHSKAHWVDREEEANIALNDIVDVNVDLAVANDALVFNGAVWGPSHLTYNYTFENMSDGPGTMEGHAGEFMIVDPTESELVFISLADLLATSTLYLQNMGDVDQGLVDANIGNTLVVYKPDDDSGLYKFKYLPLPTIPNYKVSKDGTQIVAAMASLNFAGMNVTHVGNDVTVTPIPLDYQAEGEDVGGPPITAINFRGAGVGVTNVDGVLIIEVAGADTGAGGTYDLSCYFPGNLIDPFQEIYRFPVVRGFRILSNFTGSIGNCRVAPGANIVLTVNKNGTQVGAISIATDGTITYSTTTGGVINFAAGDLLEIVGPATPDATIQDFSLTIAGVKT